MKASNGHRLSHILASEVSDVLRNRQLREGFRGRGCLVRRLFHSDFVATAYVSVLIRH
jgi:hypothetical protein